MQVNEEVTDGATTTTVDIATPAFKLHGKPVFKVDDDLFCQIGYCNRKKHGWRKKFYGTSIGEWCKQNKGAAFCLMNEQGWILEVERDKYKYKE